MCSLVVVVVVVGNPKLSTYSLVTTVHRRGGGRIKTFPFSPNPSNIIVK